MAYPKRKTRRRTYRAPASAQSPRPRTHAFTGCMNCRGRHVKCDLGRPSCKNCTRLELSCAGYGKKYSWLPAKMPDQMRRGSEEVDRDDLMNAAEDTQKSRRILFSDSDRVAMVWQMKEECRSASAVLDLDQIFGELQNKSQDSNTFTRIGPFGILPVGPTTPFVSEAQARDQNSTQILKDACIVSGHRAAYTPSVSPWNELEDFPTWAAVDNDASLPISSTDLENGTLVLTEEYFHPSWDDPTNSLIVDSFSYTDGPLDENMVSYSEDLAQNHNGSNDYINPIASMRSTEISLNNIGLDTGSNKKLVSWPDSLPSHQFTSSTIMNIPNDANLSKVPAEARSLLEYYSTKMIDAMSMYPRSKPPWQTIHLPCAMNALAEVLVFGETKSFAKLSLFYALLSISSFHISLEGFNDSAERSEYWHDRGVFHQAKAVGYLKSALGANVTKARRGKYKELLMSVLSMVTIGVFNGIMEDAHRYLAKSESLIKTQGFPKPVKSQKVSKLHNIFSYLKIIEESTALRVGEQHTTQSEFSTTGHEMSLVSHKNTTESKSVSRLAWDEDNETEDVQEDPLFISIYQVPKTLLSLLSQTSSLCKQLQSAGSSAPDFQRRSRIIEDRIFNWKAPKSFAMTDLRTAQQDDAAGDSACSASDIAAHVVAAMHTALVVHFQRQIRNTDPRILQHYIISTADHLLAHENLKKRLGIPSAPFPWPSFIAGCEAYDTPSRTKIEAYLYLMRAYNVGNLIAAEKVIREVWRRQDLGRFDSRWEDVLRDWDMRIVLT